MTLLLWAGCGAPSGPDRGVPQHEPEAPVQVAPQISAEQAIAGVRDEILLSVNIFLADEVAPLVVSAPPAEGCAPGFHSDVAVTLHLPSGPLTPATDFRPGQCCAPFDRVESPEHTVAFSATCAPVACANCAAATQLIFVPRDSPEETTFLDLDLGCHEAGSGLPALCTSLEAHPEALVVTLPQRQVEPCEGGVRSARERQTTLRLTAGGIATEDGPWRPFRKDLWRCDE